MTGAYSRRMDLRFDDGTSASARIKGKRLKPVCGDRVCAEPIENESDWLITDIEQRKNELTRPDARGRTDVLAANVTCLVAMAAPEPAPDWFIIDRYLAAAETMHADAIVVYNKADVAQPTQETRETMDDYRRCGYAALLCSAVSGDGLVELEEQLADRVTIIVGQSGVGKSSVINRLVGDGRQKTGDVSASSGEGKHTTVNSVMIELPSGGYVIDSPGVRDYAPAIEDPDEVVRGFREINQSGEACRFANCRHLREPDCAVKAAVDDGDISARRYESYRRLLRLANDLVSKKY